MIFKNTKCPAKKPSGELSLAAYFLTVTSMSEAVSYPPHQAVFVLLTRAASLNKVQLLPRCNCGAFLPFSPAL